MPENDFLQFSNSGAANVITQAAYAALGNLTTGFVAGTAASNQVNKILRQTTSISAMLAQTIVDVTGATAIDDGTIATLESNFRTAIYTQAANYYVDSGAVNAYAITMAPVPASLAAIVGVPIQIKISNTNTNTACTLTVNGLAATAMNTSGGQLPAVGSLQAGTIVEAIYDGTNFKVSNLVQSSIAVGGTTRKLAATLAAAGNSVTFTADEVVVETSLMGVPYKLSTYNQTLNISTTGAGGMDTGTAPASSFVSIYAIYNPTTRASGILATNVATSSGTIYSGANMPAGYTASCLLGFWPTNATPALVAGYWRERTFSYSNYVNVLGSGTATVGTSVSLSSAVPPTAVSYLAIFSTQNNSAVTGTSNSYYGPDSVAGTVQIDCQVVGENNPSSAEVIIATSQTTYYKSGNATTVSGIAVTGFRI